MANRNILNKVKTASGYDTLYPMTPYQIHYASAVSGTSSAYQVTIPFPAANITVPIIVYFKPNTQNAANCTISVNNLAAKTLYVNNSAITSGTLTSNDTCLVEYDVNKNYATILSISSGANATSDIQYSTVDLNDGSSALRSGSLYIVYEE